MSSKARDANSSDQLPVVKSFKNRNLDVVGGLAAIVVAAGGLFAAYKLGAFRKLKGLAAKKPDSSLSDLETALVDLVKPKRRRRRG